MLRALAFALNHLEHVQRCHEKAPTINGLWGFQWWLRGRSCKVCGQRIAPSALKYCSRRCLERAMRWRNPGRRLKAQTWFAFSADNGYAKREALVRFNSELRRLAPQEAAVELDLAKSRIARWKEEATN